jgi:hypothetical protein
VEPFELELQHGIVRRGCDFDPVQVLLPFRRGIEIVRPETMETIRDASRLLQHSRPLEAPERSNGALARHPRRALVSSVTSLRNVLKLTSTPECDCGMHACLNAQVAVLACRCWHPDASPGWLCGTTETVLSERCKYVYE